MSVETTIYTNRGCENTLEIPSFGKIERLTDRVWLKESGELIYSIDISNLWWKEEIIKKYEPGDTVRGFDGIQCLINLIDGEWMVGVVYISKDYSNNFLIYCFPPGMSLLTGERLKGIARIKSDQVKAMIKITKN